MFELLRMKSLLPLQHKDIAFFFKKYGISIHGNYIFFSTVTWHFWITLLAL